MSKQYGLLERGRQQRRCPPHRLAALRGLWEGKSFGVGLEDSPGDLPESPGRVPPRGHLQMPLCAETLPRVWG